MTLPGNKGVWGIHAGDWGQVYLVDHEEEDEKAPISRNFNTTSKNIHSRNENQPMWRSGLLRTQQRLCQKLHTSNVGKHQNVIQPFDPAVKTNYC
jgi:hypothetical protein